MCQPHSAFRTAFGAQMPMPQFDIPPMFEAYLFSPLAVSKGKNRVGMGQVRATCTPKTVSVQSDLKIRLKFVK